MVRKDRERSESSEMDREISHYTHTHRIWRRMKRHHIKNNVWNFRLPFPGIDCFINVWLGHSSRCLEYSILFFFGVDISRGKPKRSISNVRMPKMGICCDDGNFDVFRFDGTDVIVIEWRKVEIYAIRWQLFLSISLSLWLKMAMCSSVHFM